MGAFPVDGSRLAPTESPAKELDHVSIKRGYFLAGCWNIPV